VGLFLGRLRGDVPLKFTIAVGAGKFTTVIIFKFDFLLAMWAEDFNHDTTLFLIV
jgi:hypothetical protein